GFLVWVPEFPPPCPVPSCEGFVPPASGLVPPPAVVVVGGTSFFRAVIALEQRSLNAGRRSSCLNSVLLWSSDSPFALWPTSPSLLSRVRPSPTFPGFFAFAGAAAFVMISSASPSAFRKGLNSL